MAQLKTTHIAGNITVEGAVQASSFTSPDGSSYVLVDPNLASRANVLPKFESNTTLGVIKSIISDDGSTATISGNLTTTGITKVKLASTTSPSRVLTVETDASSTAQEVKQVLVATADTPNALVARDGNGGTTLRALQLKKSDGTVYFDANDGEISIDGVNIINRVTQAGNAYSGGLNDSYWLNACRITSCDVTANAPSSNGWYLIYNNRHRGGTGDGNLYGAQIAIGMTVAQNEMYFRHQIGGAWSAWKKVWHTDNDGSGSGLDADLLDGYHSTDIVPIGGIIMYAGGSTTDPAPTLNNFLYCDGSAISRIIYSNLFNVIGTTFGAGNGSTTFNIPNLKGVVPRGMGQQAINGRTKDGSTLGALLEDRIQNVTGGFRADNLGTIATYDAMYSYGTIDRWSKEAGPTSLDGIAFDASRVARTGDYTRDNSLSVRFYIRYK